MDEGEETKPLKEDVDNKPMTTPSLQEHTVGITNASEENPDVKIADQTKHMNPLFEAKRYSEAANLAIEITAQSKDELESIFIDHGIEIIYLNHEAYGIFEGEIEPTYDLVVRGSEESVNKAAKRSNIFTKT